MDKNQNYRNMWSSQGGQPTPYPNNIAPPARTQSMWLGQQVTNAPHGAGFIPQPQHQGFGGQSGFSQPLSPHPIPSAPSPSADQFYTGGNEGDQPETISSDDFISQNLSQSDISSSMSTQSSGISMGTTINPGNTGPFSHTVSGPVNTPNFIPQTQYPFSPIQTENPCLQLKGLDAIVAPQEENNIDALERTLETLGQQVFNMSDRNVAHALYNANLIGLFSVLRDANNKDYFTIKNLMGLRPQRNKSGQPVTEKLSKILGLKKVPSIMGSLVETCPNAAFLVFVLVQDLIYISHKRTNPNAALACAIGGLLRAHHIDLGDPAIKQAIVDLAHKYKLVISLSDRNGIEAINTHLKNNFQDFKDIPIEDMEGAKARFLNALPEEIAKQSPMLVQCVQNAQDASGLMLSAMMLEQTMPVLSSGVRIPYCFEMMRAIVSAPAISVGDFFGLQLSEEELKLLEEDGRNLTREDAMKKRLMQSLNGISDINIRNACLKVAMLELELVSDEDVGTAQTRQTRPYEQLTNVPAKRASFASELFKKYHEKLYSALGSCYSSIASSLSSHQILSQSAYGTVVEFPVGATERERMNYCLQTLLRKMQCQPTIDKQKELLDPFLEILMGERAVGWQIMAEKISSKVNQGHIPATAFQEEMDALVNILMGNSSVFRSCSARGLLSDEEYDIVSDPLAVESDKKIRLILKELETAIENNPDTIKTLAQILVRQGGGTPYYLGQRLMADLAQHAQMR